MRDDMTIEELVEGIKKDTQKILEEFLIDNPRLIAMTLLNGVRLICIEGIIDGRDEEVFGYLSGCIPEDLRELRRMLEEDDSDDSEWKKAVQTLLRKLPSA